MNAVCNFCKNLQEIVLSSIGKKLIMAFTGLGLVAFVVVHMAGNLQIFLGAEALNKYAMLLRTSEELLWLARVGLIALVVGHIGAAFLIVKENSNVRPKGYKSEKSVATFASRTMIFSGLIVLAFIIYHILHFTTMSIDTSYAKIPHVEIDGRHGHDVYSMVVKGFASLPVSIFYIGSVALLCWHLSHGIGSMFQTLGLRNRQSEAVVDLVGVGTSMIIFVGMAAVPAAVLATVHLNVPILEMPAETKSVLASSSCSNDYYCPKGSCSKEASSGGEKSACGSEKPCDKSSKADCADCCGNEACSTDKCVESGGCCGSCDVTKKDCTAGGNCPANKECPVKKGCCGSCGGSKEESHEGHDHGKTEKSEGV